MSDTCQNDRICFQKYCERHGDVIVTWLTKLDKCLVRSLAVSSEVMRNLLISKSTSRPQPIKFYDNLIQRVEYRIEKLFGLYRSTINRIEKKMITPRRPSFASCYHDQDH